MDPVCSEASVQQLLTQTEDVQIMGRAKTKCTRKPDGQSLSSKPKTASQGMTFFFLIKNALDWNKKEF